MRRVVSMDLLFSCVCVCVVISVTLLLLYSASFNLYVLHVYYTHENEKPNGTMFDKTHLSLNGEERVY